MNYTIKYIRLFEANKPFKRISSTEINNDSFDDLANSSLGTLEKIVKDEFIKNYENNIQEQYSNSFKTYYNKLGFPDNITNLIYENMVSFFDDYNKLYTDLDVKINYANKTINVVIPVNTSINTIGYGCTDVIFIQAENNKTPFNIYNGLLEFIFNDEKNGYIPTLKTYSLNDYHIYVKFKIMNPKDMSMPNIVFFGYSDLSYINDFKKGFADMFTNIDDILSSNRNVVSILFVSYLTNLPDERIYYETEQLFDNKIRNRKVDHIEIDPASNMYLCIKKFLEKHYISMNKTALNCIIDR